MLTLVLCLRETKSPTGRTYPFQKYPTQLLLQIGVIMTFTTRTKRTIAASAGAAILGVAVIGAVVPSGATFTDTKPARIDIHTASLSLGVSDDDNSGTIDLPFNNLKPGETQSLKFNVTNTGSIDATGSVGSNFSNSTPPANVDYSQLSVGIHADNIRTQPVLTPVTQLPSSWDLGTIKAGETKTYFVDVKLDQNANNSWQNKSFGGEVPVTLTQQ